MEKLKEGDPAPAFTASDQDGKQVSLTDFTGKKVILYFYPKDNTPGCTAEACNFRDHYESLTADGFEVIGISVDGEKSHQKFIDKYNLPFTLLVDEDKKIVNDYQVWIEKNMYGRKYMGTARKTFIIDENGNIEHIIHKVDTKNSVDQIRKILN